MLTVPLVLAASCSDKFVDDTDGNAHAGETKGEKILFTVGTTNNAVTTRAGDAGPVGAEPAKSYYMADGSRFVCRMYYVANAGSSNIDVKGGTDFMAWLKVDGTVGNSLYWNKFYEPVSSEKGYGGIDDLGNDYSADAFYWQNRKDHVFLAMTDLNKARNGEYRYGVSQGSLKLTPADLSYTVKSSKTKHDWVPSAYRIEGIDREFASWQQLREYVESVEDIAAFNAQQANTDAAKLEWSSAKYEYAYGWSCKFSKTNAVVTGNDSIQETGPIRYLMYYDAIPFDEGSLPADRKEIRDDNGKLVAYADKYGIYLCNVVYKKDSEGKETDEVEGLVKTDDYGNTLYNEESPRYTFYYTEQKVDKEVPDQTEYNVNRYDLTRNGRTSMAEQPDICQAKTKQAPLGATQAANRVNLYFKHQFSQVQVNIKNASDNSVTIQADQLMSVELLGVTEEGYVCVDLKENGDITHAPMYKSVDISTYSEEELEHNPYGTSFEMFEKDEAIGGYLKSYDCITFGQLQAIRITWRESLDDDAFIHTATFRVTEPNLQNLESGVRYVWNMELRRGTLAVIRAEIDDWIVPDDELKYEADGTINN